MVISLNAVPTKYLTELMEIKNIRFEQDDIESESDFVILYDITPDYLENRISARLNSDPLNSDQSIIVILNTELTNKLMNEYYGAGASVVCDCALTPTALKNLLISISAGERYNWLVRNVYSNKNYRLSDNTVFNGASGTIETYGEKIQLNNKEREILQILLDNQGKYMQKEVFLTTLWGNTSTSASRSFDVYINRLRHILENDSYVDIRKIRKVGYAIIKGEENKKIKNKY